MTISEQINDSAWATWTQNGKILSLGGRLDAAGTAAVWNTAMNTKTVTQSPLLVDASQVSYLDGSGAGLLIALRLNRSAEIQNLSPRLSELLNLYDFEKLKADAGHKPPPQPGLIEEIGKGALSILSDLRELVSFTGECAAALVYGLAHPRRIRYKDALRAAENAGVNGLPIVLLIGFLMGLIMGFQSAIPLQQFGAEIFIAKLLTISMNRELGPLVTAILLAGRTGSAFAAELGTMKINEEVNALKTMGLDPIRFLVLPRVFGALVVTPALTLFFILLSLVGGAVILLSFDYTLATYLDQVESSFRLKDILGGLFKSVAFSLVVAGVGCQRGLSTGAGPSAVGDSTTRAVVSAIILIALLDGVFAVAFYALGL